MEIAKIKINGTNAEVSELKTITSGMVGATVGIEYDNTWDGLQKQVVFKTAFQTVNADGCTVPPELLRISGVNLLAGVYGYTGDGSVAIPTVWASLGSIQSGADPEGDEAAKPTNPIWMEAITTSRNADGKADSAYTEAAAANAAAASASATASAASEKAYAALEELDRLNGVLPAVTAEDAGKALVVSADGKIIADDGMIEQDVLAEQVLTFITDPNDPQNPYGFGGESLLWPLAVGETYYVVWDGVTYICTALGPRFGEEVPEGYVFAAIGNESLLELGEDTGEPFFFLYESYEGESTCSAYTNSPDLTLTEVSHTVRIYQRVKAVPYYTKAEIDAALGSYINDVDTLIGDVDALLGGGA